MKQKLSQEVMRRKNLCEIVLGAVRIQGRRIADSLGEILTPLLQPEEQQPDFGLMFDLYGRSLELHCRHMEDADEAHRQQTTAFDEIRNRRDELSDRLKERYLSLRATCTGVLGEKSLAPLGLDINMAQEPKAVLAQTRIVRDRLRRPGVALVPERWITGSPLDPESLAQEFDDDVEALTGTLREVVDQGKSVDILLVAKQKSIEDFQGAFIPIAQALEASFRVAGEVELADRIRPTIRRLTRPSEDEQPPASEDTAPPSQESSEESPPSEGSPEDSATSGDGSSVSPGASETAVPVTV
jgi:hypothetical protein